VLQQIFGLTAFDLIYAKQSSVWMEAEWMFIYCLFCLVIN
jgi:hypothetical protein